MSATPQGAGAEVEEAVLGSRRNEQHVALLNAACAALQDEPAVTGGDDVQLVSGVGLLPVDVLGLVELDFKAAVPKQRKRPAIPS